MRFLIVFLMGLMLPVQAHTAQPSTVSGQVRLANGRPVAGAQVTLFDLADLHQGAVARAMTDESGYFAVPLASLGGPALPQGFALGQNYPNPFNPSTVIPYQLPMATHVRLDVFNVLGQHIATLVDAERQAGFHAAKWDATDAAGQAMAAGVYFYRLTVGGGWQTQRMVLIDGQAGIVAEASSTAATMSTDAAEQEYGLVVSGEGLTTYADAAFGVRVGMAEVELVVDAAPLTRDKVLAGEILGDVNNDGQVVLEDAMLAVMYSSNPSIAMPNNGSILLGDVNGDGEVNETDVLVIMRYISNPLDGALPAGIGQRIASGKRVSDDLGIQLTDQAANKEPAWSPDGAQIAFSSNRAGNYEIYVMDKDGSNKERLTETNQEFTDDLPAWSPDGLRIAFSRSFRSGDSIVTTIQVMDKDGSNGEPLTEGKEPAWSPDGAQIAFSSNRAGNYEIYVMNKDGSNKERLTEGVQPAWSPDGAQIAFSSNRAGNYEIYVMDKDGLNKERLTYNSSDDRTPTWSPDGAQIAFSSGSRGIYVMNVDGSNKERLTEGVQPAWSPDGAQIAFNRGGNLEIYVMDDSGTGADDSGTGADDSGTGADDSGTGADDSGTGADDSGTGADDSGTGADDSGTGAEGEERTFSLLEGASMEFVWIEPGVFQMGSNTGRKDESPVHEVEISRGFWLGKYEITQGQWKAVMDKEPWSGRARVEANSSHPAVIISWDEVHEFIGRLNAEAGEELYRLPTEAEWEYACRAGTQTRWSFGDDESLLTDYAWYHGNNYPNEGAKAVGGREPNPWGLYDMHGNVWEWIQDWYDEDYYNSSPQVDPPGPTSGLGRVIRGGHFGHFNGVRSAYRHFHSPDSRSYTIGARLLRIPGN